MLAATSDREKSRPQARGRHDGVVSAARRMDGDRGRVTQFLTAFHGSRIPMVVVDNHRRYLDANGAARLLFRMSLGEFRRRQIDELTPREGLARMELLWSQLLAQGEVSGGYDVRF